MTNPKRKGLGRGLSALISAGDPDERRSARVAPRESNVVPMPEPAGGGDQLVSLNPRDIRPNPKQPRNHFDDAQLEELANSIRSGGVQQPVIVRRRDSHYELVSGERRVRASVLAELDRIPAVVRDVSDDDMLKLGLIENIHREDLNPIETARAYQALLDEFGWTQDELAAEVGKKRATITNSLRLLHLPDDIQEQVSSGEITMGHARALVSVANPEEQRRLTRRIVQDQLSVREIERMISEPATASPKKLPSAAPVKRDPHVVDVEDRLRRHLGTKVRISVNSDDRGKIEVEFYDLDDLERILDLLRV